MDINKTQKWVSVWVGTWTAKITDIGIQKSLWSSWNAFEYPRRQGMLSSECTQKDKDRHLWRNSKSQPLHAFIHSDPVIHGIDRNAQLLHAGQAMGNMANFSMIVLEGLFSKQVVTSGSWAHRFSDVKHCNYSVQETKSLFMSKPHVTCKN